MPGGAVATGGAFANPFKQPIVKRGYVWPYLLVTSLFFLWGFAYGLLDVLNKHFQNVLGISKTQSTTLQVAYFGVGYFLFSPIAGEILKRKGYKFTVITGLAFYSTGAIFFWPVAKFSVGTTNPGSIFAGFVVCTAVIACGLATLEVAANSYASVVPPVKYANLRLQFSQACNGVASFTGPLLASHVFFSDENADNLNNVQWVYLGVSLLGVAIATLFFFSDIPEVTEEALQSEIEDLSQYPGLTEKLAKPFWHQTRAITGFVAQFLYVGAQVTIGSFFLNYTAENAGIADSLGSNLLSYGLIMFTVGRFIGTAILVFVSGPVVLFGAATIAAILSILIGTLHGWSGVVCAMLIMFFESVQFPIIFVLSTTNLGRHTRRASALLVMGISGGAAFPPIQGVIADTYGIRPSFFIVLPCFIYLMLWAVYMWNEEGRRVWVSKSDEPESPRLKADDKVGKPLVA
ncbi:MFS general substrate transporter [Gonapodya prolifera JEL478]|uniref:MFS general substrate transporter n=1 Tax=Gonapodya prolifera (strain JEL478) TaxID=1344416 RepID=A0A139AD17_GONPJ|nr:MFS general substrate transporter [Gonapodya prolifera JEL478]|eukprot:KXS14660.1 MFS general substrate transporter [Gonapodya prolifera JEL478]